MQMADACSPSIRNIYLKQAQGRIVRYRPSTSPVQNIMSPQGVLWLKGGLKNPKEAARNGMRMYPMRAEMKQKTNFAMSLPRPKTSEAPRIFSDGTIKSQYANLRSESNNIRRRYAETQRQPVF